MAVYAWKIKDPSAPGPKIKVVTPADGSDQTNTINGVVITGFRALRADGAGDIKVTMADGSTPTLKFAAGETRVGQFVRVWSTGTTATTIEGHV